MSAPAAMTWIYRDGVLSVCTVGKAARFRGVSAGIIFDALSTMWREGYREEAQIYLGAIFVAAMAAELKEVSYGPEETPGHA